MGLGKAQKDSGPWALLRDSWPFYWVNYLWQRIFSKIKLSNFDLKFCTNPGLRHRMLTWKFQFKDMFLALNTEFSPKLHFVGICGIVLTFLKFNDLEKETCVWTETFLLISGALDLDLWKISSRNSRVWFYWILAVIGD